MISISLPEDADASRNCTKDGSNDVHMGHHPAAKYSATRFPFNLSARASGAMADPSDVLRDGRDDMADAAHWDILRLGARDVRALTKARQASGRRGVIAIIDDFLWVMVGDGL